MWRQLIIPGLAVVAITFALTHVVSSQHVPPVKIPVVQPPRSSFARSVAGAGLVEARSDASNTADIAVGSEVPGVVARVRVRVSDKVHAGDVLFELDDRQMQAELKARAANLAAAQAQFQRLKRMPRAEELPPLEAKLREAESNLTLTNDQLRRAERLFETNAIGEEEMILRRQARAAAVAQHAYVKAQLDLMRAGAWDADLAVAQAAVAQAEALLAQTRTELDRRVVRAPIEATVLQVNLRPGEFAGTPPNAPLIVLGDLEKLHVRVDISESDIHRFRPGQPAEAKLRGDPSQVFPLKFVRVEPYVIPKKALTGDHSERVDTRVLQVIYAVEAQHPNLYVGQQLDVFIAAESPLPGTQVPQ